jgi:hypothetical protein
MQEEIEEVKTALDASTLETATADFIVCKFARTHFNSLKLRLMFPKDYPSSALLVEITSNVLPTGLLKKMTKQCDVEAAKHVGGKQIMPVIELVRSTIDNSRMLYAFKEVRETAQLMQGHGTMTVLDTKGVVKLRIEAPPLGNYFLEVSLMVPENYPVDAIEIKMGVYLY